VRLGGSPLAVDPALLLEAQQRRVDGALIERERAMSELLDPPGQTVAMHRTHDVEGLQHHQVESPVLDFAGAGWLTHRALSLTRSPVDSQLVGDGSGR